MSRAGTGVEEEARANGHRILEWDGRRALELSVVMCEQRGAVGVTEATQGRCKVSSLTQCRLFQGQSSLLSWCFQVDIWLLFMFCSDGNGTQGLLEAEQMPCHLASPPA